MLSCCPWIPNSLIFLLLLLPSLLSTENFLYQYPDWKNYHGLGLDPRTFYHENRNPRHMLYQTNTNVEPCQATPDIYFVLDKYFFTVKISGKKSDRFNDDYTYEHDLQEDHIHGHKVHTGHYFWDVGQIWILLYELSSSMLHGWPHVHKFVLDMVTRLSNDNLRISIISYSCKGNILLPITGNREEIRKGIERLKYSITAGNGLIYHGLWKANKQLIRAEKRGFRRPSTIIFLLNSPLNKQNFDFAKVETDDTQNMGFTIIGVGTDQSDRNQIISLSSPKNAFIDKRPEHLNGIIAPLATKVCPSLKAAITRIICIRESNPVVVEGFGFDFAMRKEDVVCRFHVGGILTVWEDFPPINITKTLVTCPGPIVHSAGQAIHILLSLDSGKNFLHKGLYVASRTCGKSLTTAKTAKKTTPKKTTSKVTTPKPPNPPKPAIITKPIPMQPKPSIDKLIFAPVILALLLLLLLTGCLWQLCCVSPVEELPPPKPQPQPVEEVSSPKPQPQPRDKKQPPPVSPPAPTVPVSPPPIVIICCCTCRGLYVSRDVEGNMTVYNFNPLRCPQLPLIWPQYSEQELLKKPCIPKVSLLPNEEHLPLASCFQCHHLPASCSRHPSGLRQLTLPSRAPRAPR